MPLKGYGALAGPFFICGISGENFCSLTDAQVQKYRKMFLRPQIFLHTERGVGYLEYDNVSLPGAPKEAIDQFKKRNGLPEVCCCLLPGTEMPVLVRYGERRMFRWKYGSREKGRKRSPAV